MTLCELEETLPHGLHDAYLSVINVNFMEGVATFGMEILAHADSAPTRYEAVELSLRGLRALILDAPARLAEPFDGPIGTSSFKTTNTQLPGFSALPDDVKRLFLSFYVQEPWNTVHPCSMR